MAQGQVIPAIGSDVTALMASHEPEQKRPEQVLAESDPNYVGNDPNIGKRALDNAPAIGALAATMAGPGGLVPSMLLAGGGGYLGARLRGDDRQSAAMTGAGQAALEGGGGLLMRIGKMVGKGLMKGTVPKPIGKEYADVDIPQEMLDRGAFPGSATSAKRISGLSKAANQERHAAAQTVPNMPRSKVIAGLRPVHAEHVTAKEPQMADDVLEYMRTSARNIGPSGLDGPAQLARKTVKQRQGKAALNAGNSKEAAVVPQAAEAERGAITAHMRETPRMANALDESQTLMAIDDVMKDAAHSNPVTRARVGGLTASTLSPIGLGATAHAVNQGSNVFNPQVVRLLDMLMRGRE